MEINQCCITMHGQSIIKICTTYFEKKILDILFPEFYNSGKPSVIDKYLHFNIIMHFYIKLEINQGYTTMHGQPIIKVCSAKQARQIYYDVDLLKMSRVMLETCRGF